MEKLLQIINTVLVERSSKLRDDLGFDSLDLAELTVRIEDEFNVDIFEDGLVETIEEVFVKLNNR